MVGLNQYANYGVWILQAVVGIIFIVHGIEKARNPVAIAAAYHAPAFVGAVHGLVEILGGIALIFNLFTFWISLIFALIMLGAIYFKIFVWKVSFWSKNGTGWEFDLLLLAVFIFLLTK